MCVFKFQLSKLLMKNSSHNWPEVLCYDQNSISWNPPKGEEHLLLKGRLIAAFFPLEGNENVRFIVHCPAPSTEPWTMSSAK